MSLPTEWPPVYKGAIGITIYSMSVSLVARLTGFEPAYYYLLVSLLAGALANVLAAAFMTERRVGTMLVGLVFSVAIIVVLMLLSPPIGRIVYPLDGDHVDSQRVHISGTFVGLRGKQVLTVCVPTPNDPSGRKHPCWSTRTHGTLFETETAIYLGTEKENGTPPHTIELRATDRRFQPFSEEMKPNEEGRLLDSIVVFRVPQSQ